MESVGIEGELLRHEADLNDGTNAVGEEVVIDLVDVGEVVDGVAVLVFVVDSELIVQDGVEANVFEVGDLFYGFEVVEIALTKHESAAAGAEHLLPEVGKGSGGGVGIDLDVFLRARWESPRVNKEQEREVQDGTSEAVHFGVLLLDDAEKERLWALPLPAVEGIRDS
jgi:hypothetical protein